jgi:ABC-2 type transport system permease protein
MERFLLFLLDRFRALYETGGVDYRQLRSIVQVKLMMDNRRQSGIMGQQRSGRQRGFFFALIMYAIFGFLVSIIIYAVPSTLVSMLIIFSYIMVTVIMVLITDFSTVLLDTSDNSIVLPRPVSSRTLLAARITHIALYVGMLVLALSLGSIIAVCIQFTAAAIIGFIVCLGLSTLLAITITNALYLLVMRFTSEERMKNIINYLQIGMTVLFMGSYQLMPRLVGSAEGFAEGIAISAWMYLVPPFWFSATVELLQHNSFDAAHLSMVLLACIVPGAALYLYRNLTSVFTNKLQELAIETRGTNTQTSTLSTLFDWPSRFLPNGGERSGFTLTQRALARDRKLKLKLYPSIGYFLVLAVVVSFRSFSNVEDLVGELQQSKMYLGLLYFCSLVLYTAYFEISFSDDFKAAWVFFSSPLKNPGAVLAGSLVALVTTLFVPFYFFIGAIVLFIWGTAVLDDLVFGLINNLIIILSISLIHKKNFPLSLPEGARNSSTNFARGILMMLVVGALGFLHYGISFVPWSLWVLIPLFASGVYFMFQSFRKLSWEEITKG